MRKVMVDTNVLLDLVSADRPRHGEARAVCMAMAERGWEPHALVSSLKDVYYIYARHYGDEATARRRVGYLIDAFELDALEPAHAKAALLSSEPDFEDGLIRAVAEEGAFDFILTRDKAGFLGSRAAKVSPPELSAILADGRA